MNEMELCISCFKQIGEDKVCPHCHTVQKLTPKEAFHIYPKTVLNDRYLIGEVIGYGGFGVTYKALDLRLNEIVAIKEYFPAGLVNRVPGETEVIQFPGEKGERFAEGKARFLNEARNTAKFSNNPNIANVFDFFEANNTAYIIMEFLDGISLKQYIKQNNGKLDVDSSLEIINKIIAGLEVVHRAGIIHRDISPDNVLLTLDNKVKIIDFGAARFSSVDKESTFSIVLKQGYAPPEQYRNKSKQGPFTDVYAVGAMLYAMLTGEIPEESVDRQIEDVLKPPSELEPTIPQYLDSVIMKALSIKSDLRFQTMEQFAEALNGNRAVLLPEEELKKRQKKRKISFGIIGAIIGICICVGVVFKIATQDINLNRYIKENAVIEVWVPVSDDETKKAATQAIYNEIYSAFDTMLAEDDSKKALKATLDVEVKYIPESQYEQAVFDAAQSGTLPDIYRTDLVAESNSDIALSDVSWIRKKIIKDSYMLYENEGFCTYSLPVSFDANVLYINNRYDTDKAFSSTSSIEKIVSAADQLSEGVVPLVINPECEVFYEDNDEQILEINQSSEPDYAIKQFTSEKAACYFGKISELPEIKASPLKWYSLNLPVSGGYDRVFAEVWGIPQKGSSDRNYAAMYVLSWLLSEEAQEIMYIDNDSFVPLNKSTNTVYVNETHQNDSLYYLTYYNW